VADLTDEQEEEDFKQWNTLQCLFSCLRASKFLLLLVVVVVVVVSCGFFFFLV
jgi:uncharacterized protein involved in exopolysaccharide biosynthesis